MWEQLHGIFILRGCHWPLLTSQIHRWNTFGFVSCQRKILNIQEKAKLLHVCIWEGQTYFLFSRNKTAHWNSIPQARNGRAPILSLSGQYWPYCKILVLMKDRCLRQKKKKRYWTCLTCWKLEPHCGHRHIGESSPDSKRQKCLCPPLTH